MKCFIVFVSLFIIFVGGDRHLNANGPFGKYHAMGDEPSPNPNEILMKSYRNPSEISMKSQ
jgi:hypothetical protein